VLGEVAAMVAAVTITRLDLDASGLRRAARRCRQPHAARRMLALALVLEGASRTDAAQAAGMDRQTLRDWVHRYNAEGLAGLRDRHGGGTPRLLSPEQEREVARWVSEGPDLAQDGVTRWRRSDLVRAIARRFGVAMAERSVSDLLRRQGFRRLVPRPRHPGHDAGRQASFRPTSPPS
jgi:transposase